jgi:hypothetical protein
LFLFHHYGLVKLKVGHKNLFREIRWSVLSCWVADWTLGQSNLELARTLHSPDKALA